MACEVKMVAHSVSLAGEKIATLQLRYWRAIHGEFMTHRVFSRNASSSRAIPVKAMLKQVWSDPAGPIHWGANQAGMQADSQLTGFKKKLAQFLWYKVAGRLACASAYLMMKAGLHKQVANRILEPWQYITVVVTSTEWENFLDLREHKDAQPEIAELASAIRESLETTQAKLLQDGEWHMPFAQEGETGTFGLSVTDRLKMSVARCARTSYLTFDRKPSTLRSDISLHDRLVDAEPPHMSPTEHQAQAMACNNWNKNFKGWRQYRSFLENGETV